MKSLKGLARRLCVPLEVLQALPESVNSQYRTFRLARGQRSRTISVPSERLKSIQRRIYDEFLKPVSLPANLHGGVLGRSSFTNAEVHVGQPWLLRIDIAGFFPSVTPHHVYSVWIDQLGCSPSVASLLTKLTTFKFSLPQGAPTSSALANLVLADADEAIEHLASQGAAQFTRYVDDLGLSGRTPHTLIHQVVLLLQRQGFKTSRRKVALVPRNARQELTGFCTSGDRPSIGKEHRARVRAAIHALSQMNPRSSQYERLLQSVRGRIRHVQRTNPGPARRLERYLERRLTRGMQA